MKLKKTDYYILGAAAIFVLYYIYKKRKTAIDAKTEREETIRISEQIESGGNGTGTGTGTAFNPKPYADKLKSDFGAYTADTTLYDELNKLSNSEIRQIWTYYDERLKNSDPQKGKTLGLALYDAYSFTRSFTFGWDWTYHAKLFYDRLNQIGLP